MSWLSKSRFVDSATMSNQFDFQKCRQDQDISPQGQHNSGLLFSNKVDYIPLGIDRIDPPPTSGLQSGQLCSIVCRLEMFVLLWKLQTNTCKQSQIICLLTFAQYHTTFMYVTCKKCIPVKQVQTNLICYPFPFLILLEGFKTMKSPLTIPNKN